MIDQEYLTNLRFEFNRLKSLAEKGLAQVSEADFFSAVDDENNSVALIVKHVGGNLKSRWSDFLTSDGEKPDRDRDQEFERLDPDSRDALMELWESGWKTLTGTIDELTADDLSKTVLIRGESHTVLQAANRSLTHTAYHVGQIILLCKQFAGESWQSPSVPKGKSNEAASGGKGYFDHYGK